MYILYRMSYDVKNVVIITITVYIQQYVHASSDSYLNLMNSSLVKGNASFIQYLMSLEPATKWDHVGLEKAEKSSQLRIDQVLRGPKTNCRIRQTNVGHQNKP